MGRPKLISDEELIKSFDAYYIEVLRGNINYFKFSDFRDTPSEHTRIRSCNAYLS